MLSVRGSLSKDMNVLSRIVMDEPVISYSYWNRMGLEWPGKVLVLLGLVKWCLRVNRFSSQNDTFQAQKKIQDQTMVNCLGNALLINFPRFSITIMFINI